MRPVTRVATLLFAMAALACSDKTPVDNFVTPLTPIGPVSIAGIWNLQTFNGLALPQPISAIDTLTASTLNMVAANSTSGTFILASTIHSVSGGQVIVHTDSLSGNYSLNGTALSLTSGGTTVSGTWGGGNTLSLSEFGSTAVFTRP